MHITINRSNGTKLSTPEAAAKIAAELQAGDPDWTYTVETYDSGWSRVAITDEDGTFVAYAD